jgi:hypothetical protein
MFLGFVPGFKWGFPHCLRGPLGLSPTLRTRAAALCQHLRLLLPARAYIYRREDLHEDANARFI